MLDRRFGADAVLVRRSGADADAADDFAVDEHRQSATLELGGSGATMPPPAAEIAGQVIDAYVAGDYRRAAQSLIT